MDLSRLSECLRWSTLVMRRAECLSERGAKPTLFQSRIPVIPRARGLLSLFPAAVAALVSEMSDGSASRDCADKPSANRGPQARRRCSSIQRAC